MKKLIPFLTFLFLISVHGQALALVSSGVVACPSSGCVYTPITTALNADSTTSSGYENFRMVYPANVSSVSGSKIKISIESGSGGNVTYDGIGICEQDTTYNCVGSVIRIKFGGSNGVTVNASATTESDETTFTFDKTKAYIITLYKAGTIAYTRKKTGMTGYALYYNSTANTDLSQTGQPAAYTADTADVLHFIPQINVCSP
jgi:hypothetical protein